MADQPVGGTMDHVRVEKTELIKKLQENRQGHRDIFEQALVVYRERVEDWLVRQLEAVRAGQKVEHRISLVQPVDYTKEYDLALQMLDMSLDEQVVIDQPDFRRFVMDQWEWTEKFSTATAAYLST